MKHALIKTLSGRAIVIGALVKIAVAALGLLTPVPSILRAIDTVASVVIAAGGAYFLFRAVVLAKERLLWRVRHKLIISYIFIGFIPAGLIVAFFLLLGAILFSTFSSYLVQYRLQALADHVGGLAERVALELQHRGSRDVASVLAERHATEIRRFPGVAIAVVPLEEPCRRAGRATVLDSTAGESIALATAGRWTHTVPPAVVPAWIGCERFQGLLATSSGGETLLNSTGDRRGPGEVRVGVAPNGDGQPVGLLVRAVAFPASVTPRYGVVVDLAVDEDLKRHLREDTGVELQQVAQVAGEDVGFLPGRAPEKSEVGRSAAELALPLSSVSFLSYRDWHSGRTGTLLASLRLSIVEIYSKVSEPPKTTLGTDDIPGSGWTRGLGLGRRSFGEGLLLVLVLIGVLFLIIEAAAFVTGLALARSITGSVHELFAGTEHVRQGDFTYKIAIRVRDQLGELAASFNSMTASIGGLLRDAAEKKRLEEELRIAHEIQMSLLPTGPLDFEGVSVSALCVPAREVGGDYYDFLPLGDQRLGVLIADVSGKGTSAALYMAELKGLMLSLCRIHSSPRALLIEANRIIAEHLDARSFITMTYAIVDLRERTMTYARAGHTPLICLPAGAGTGSARSVAPEGLVLGLKLDNGALFERLLQEETVRINEGDLYVFFTDGITEAMNDENDCFGEARLSQLIEAHAHLPPEELRERVIAGIKAFVGHASQHDDMTLILLRVGAAGTPDLSAQAETTGAFRR